MKKAGVVTLVFGEPERPSREEVLRYLERIFLANASLEEFESEEEMRRRSRELAERRVSGLLEEYREIGGSPLNAQAEEQASRLEEELRERGFPEVPVYVGTQFTEPSIAAAAARARSDGVERLVALPVYPLCGRSTTVASLEELRREVDGAEWDAELREISGWHRHPDYLALRADNVRAFVGSRGLDLEDPDTRLLFSAHGTPRKYLEEGNRYELYVEDFCRRLAGALGVDTHALGYQNHGNRRIPWTEPDVEEVVRGLEAPRAVVVPVSFMHEQSETLAELDLELREEAERRGIAFHRVPVPHDDPRFAGVLADLVEPLLNGDGDGPAPGYGQCRCRSVPGTRCLNADLDGGS